MKKTCVFALMSATLLAACGGDKPATGETAKADSVAAPAAVVTPPAAVDSVASPATAPATALAKSKTAATPARPAPAAIPATTPPPIAAKPEPVPQPVAKPAPVAAKPAPAVAASAPAIDPQSGKAKYEEACRKCHGATGVPIKVMQTKFPKLLAFDAAFFAKRSDDSVVTILMKGNGNDMKSFVDKMSHAEMLAVAAYIRSLAKQ